MPFRQIFDNPYDPTTTDYQSQTPDQAQVIKAAIESGLMKVNTWLPAQVTAVNGNQKVEIQPLLKRRYTDQTVVPLPPIQNVMVCMPMGANYSIKLPVAIGDTGIALFCQRSLDVWSVQGGLVDPADTRHHDLSDPIFIPGLYPFNAQTQDTTTDLVVTNGEAQLRLLTGGKFKIQNSSQELITNLVNLVNTLVNAMVATSIGPQPFIPATIEDLQQIQQNLQTLESGG
jgi:hypothetical protein